MGRGRITLIFCHVIAQVMMWSHGEAVCPLSEEQLRLTRTDGYINKKPLGRMSCTWTLPQRLTGSHLLVLDFTSLDLPYGRITVAGYTFGSNSPFCLLFASPDLACNMFWVQGSFPTKYRSCTWREASELPRNITYSNTVQAQYEEIFGIHYTFIACEGGRLSRPTTETNVKEGGIRNNTSMHHDGSSAKINVATVILTILFGIALICTLLVIVLLHRRLQQAKQSHVRSLVRFSKQGKSDRNTEQPDTETDDIAAYATIANQRDEETPGPSNQPDVVEAYLHGQNESPPEQASTDYSPTYATVNKPKAQP